MLSQYVDLSDEKDIVWVDDPSKYPYLREREDFVRGRKNLESPVSEFKGSRQYKVVAYATLKKDAKPYPYNRNEFRRRFWYFKIPNDPFDYPGCPCEGRMVSSIKVGEPTVYGRDF